MRNRIVYIILLTVCISAIFSYKIFFAKETPFHQVCEKRLREKQYTKSVKLNVCDQVERKFFKDRNSIQRFGPALVQAPILPIDKKVDFVLFYDPSALSAYAYCYFAFRGWFNPKELSPEQIALSASGFSILKSELKGYQSWLASDAGQRCVSSVHDSVHLQVVDLEREMGNHVSIVAFNPIGAIRSDDGLQAVEHEAWLTVNHERIHAIHVTCPEVDKFANQHWDSLSKTEREKIKEGHLSYDWSNRTVAVREALAYLLEDNPVKVLDYVGSCRM